MCAWSSEVAHGLGLSIAVRVRVRLGTGNGYYIPFFVLKVTNSYVLSSWPGAWYNSYLAAVHMHESVGETQETRAQ